MATIIFRPNGNGYANSMTPVGDTPEWKCVDEEVADGNTTHNYGWNSDLYYEMYTIAAASQGGIINNITICATAKKVGASGATIQSLIRTGGTNYVSTAAPTLYSSYVESSFQRAINPKTGVAWTWADILALQIGVQIYSESYTNELYLTQVYVVVNYTPGTNSKPRIRVVA